MSEGSKEEKDTQGAQDSIEPVIPGGWDISEQVQDMIIKAKQAGLKPCRVRLGHREVISFLRLPQGRRDCIRMSMGEMSRVHGLLVVYQAAERYLSLEVETY